MNKGSLSKNFNTLTALLKGIALKQALFEKALEWGEVYGRILYTNYCGIYQDDELEKTLIFKYINDNNLKAISPEVFSSRNSELHVISEPYASGGHTRLLEKLVNIRGKGDVLITKGLRGIEGRLNFANNVKVIYDENDLNINEFISYGKKYSTIFLHIHPDDLLSAVAAGVLKEIYSVNVILVNHADHVFSFGFYASSLIAEVSLYGMSVTYNSRGKQSSFLGIPLNISEFHLIPEVRKIDDTKRLNIFSGATGFKYKPSESLSFPKLCRLILKEIPNAKITVIGPRLVKDKWWWRVKLFYWNRLNIIAKLPFDEYTKLVSAADIYIDSFPMSGGTALPEIRSKTIPVIGLSSGSSGYTPWDAVKLKSTGEIIDSLKGFAKSKGKQIIEANNNTGTINLSTYVHGKNEISERLDGMVNEKIIYKEYADLAGFDVNFYHRQWLINNKVEIGKKVYSFVVKNWSSGGKEVASEMMKLSPLKFGLKLLSGYLKK
jgi:hypothetical protein